MKQFFFSLFFLLSSLFFLLPMAHAQTLSPTQEVYMKGLIEQVVSQSTTIGDGGYSTTSQTLKVKLLDPPDTNKEIVIKQDNDSRLAAFTSYAAGQKVVVDKSVGSDNTSHYSISDSYRIPQLIGLVLLFLLCAILFAGKKGLGAVTGLSVSLAVIIFYIVPQILFAKGDPLTVSIIGSGIILLATTFLAHGFSKQTTLALVSTFTALIAAYALAIIFVTIARLSGLGTEDSYLLEIAPNVAINPQGILLGGIIIGTLGALNDVTTTQVAAIFALFKANPNQQFLHLVTHGMSIGREHIASLVNTLILAYAGTSLPIFIFLILNPNHLPWWVMLNNQLFGEEIVRSVAGSIGLMLSVPIATVLAAYFVEKILHATPHHGAK